MERTKNIEITGKVYLLFEQSGTFKAAFKRKGYEAHDVDICDNFGETDFVLNIFDNIDMYLRQRKGFFANINQHDFVMAFFPCTYFCDANALLFRVIHNSYRNLSPSETLLQIIERSNRREQYYRKFCELIKIAIDKNLRLVIENPYNGSSFLRTFAPYPPDFIDTNRQRHGDYFKKPTAYWAFNCTLHGQLQIIPKYQDFNIKRKCAVPRNKGKTISRSLISPEYANNFVENAILYRSNIDEWRLF